MLVTALVTPFRDGVAHVDLDLLQKLAAFQLAEGAHQVLLAATTGEGANLLEDERARLLDAVLEVARPEQIMFGIGPGRLPEVLARGRQALDSGVRDLLLVDCPYCAPSSAALREAWHGPVAEALPEARLIPYAVPARTGCELLPDDLARLVEAHPNVVGVKDATGRLARMERVRSLLGPDFRLLCGDDLHLRSAMIDPAIRAAGGCSVASNLAPASLRALVDACARGDAVSARELHDALTGLFSLVLVTAEETVRVAGEALQVPQRSKNPVPVKAALEELGVPVGGCRPPLGHLGANGRAHVRSVLEQTTAQDPTLLAPLSAHFGRDAGTSALADGELVPGGR